MSFVNFLCASSPFHVVGQLGRLIAPAGRKFSRMKRLSRNPLRRSSLVSNALPYRIITLAPSGGACFEPSVEQHSHDDEREKSKSTKNTANDRTSVV